MQDLLISTFGLTIYSVDMVQHIINQHNIIFYINIPVFNLALLGQLVNHYTGN